MSHNTTAASPDWKAMEGKIISRGFLPGYVVLSFLISYIGGWTTLELINRRTSSKGLYNWSLLVGASISMGGIAIWCMHFIGNRAIVLGDGAIQLQIYYSAGLTTISFFLPIIVLFIAFAAVGSNEEISIVRLVLGGTLAGLGVCGMHYLGQASITNYDCIYFVAFVIGAGIIAVVAATAALGIFFVFRSQWNAVWWKRAICAVILASAVSGMHWLASVGTEYRLKQGASFSTDDKSRDATTVSVIILSIGGCFILLVSTLLAQAQRAREANRAQQVTLVTAVFDISGKLLVTSDGLLPSKLITDTYREKNFDDVFGISHPAFLWMYRVSRNWAGISSLVPGMREHLNRAGLRGRLGLDSGKFMNDGDIPINDYTMIFRELFCAAAAELAEDLNHPLEQLGVMYDEIVHSGKKPQFTTLKRGGRDVEHGQAQDGIGKGQLLFLVRMVDRTDAQQLQAAGYRFTSISNVLSIIGGVFQISRDDLSRHLDIMLEYARDPSILDAGCHLALFAVRASMSAGFDILARKDATNQLPTMQLPFDTLESFQVDYLKTMENMTVAECMKNLNKASKAASTPPKEKAFAGQLLFTLEALKDEVDDPMVNDATLITKPIQAPCRGLTKDSPPGMATLIVFRLMIPIHSRPPGKKLEFTPLVFFRVQQHVYKNSRDHAFFARKTYREFAPALNLSGASTFAVAGGNGENEGQAQVPYSPGERRGSNKSNKFVFWGRRNSRQEMREKGDSSSEKNLVDMESEDLGPGRIMVSREVSVDVAAGPQSRGGVADGKKGAGIEMTNLSKEPKTVREEAEMSYVDELFKIAIQSR